MSLGSAVTLLELAAAAAGAGIIAIHIRKSPFENAHHLLRFAPAPDQPGHELHREIDVMKEQLETGTEVVQARLTIRRFDKPILGTFAVAGKAHAAFPAVSRERVALVLTEF